MPMVTVKGQVEESWVELELHVWAVVQKDELIIRVRV